MTPVLTLLKILYNPIVFPTLAAYFASLVLKLIIGSWQKKRLTFRAVLKDGGMPSSHTAFVIGLASAIFLYEGTTTVFWLSVAFAFIVMRDAVSVRYETGQQGKAINKIVKKLSLDLKGKHLKELVGHTPLQVIAGIILGILVSSGTYMALFV
jgi:uncharacterized protein